MSGSIEWVEKSDKWGANYIENTCHARIYCYASTCIFFDQHKLLEGEKKLLVGYILDAKRCLRWDMSGHILF